MTYCKSTERGSKIKLTFYTLLANSCHYFINGTDFSLIALVKVNALSNCKQNRNVWKILLIAERGGAASAILVSRWNRSVCGSSGREAAARRTAGSDTRVSYRWSIRPFEARGQILLRGRWPAIDILAT